MRGKTDPLIQCVVISEVLWSTLLAQGGDLKEVYPFIIACRCQEAHHQLDSLKWNAAPMKLSIGTLKPMCALYTGSEWEGLAFPSMSVIS